jgi:hypothetical protein
MFALWWILVTVMGFCLWSEAVIFIHQTRAERIRNLVGAMVLYSLFAVVLEFLARLLKLPRDERHPSPEPDIAPRTALGVLGAGVAYAIYYYIFGALAFFLFTKPYYTGTGPLAGAQEAAMALGWWLPLIQIGRGTLMTLGVLPIIRSLRMKRFPAAVYIGLLLWIVGGVAPLMTPNPIMPGRLRVMHMLEILSQNFPLGVTAVLLLRRKESNPNNNLADSC